MSLQRTTGSFIGGIDEAGRGPLIGSVYAACVVLPDVFDIEEDVIINNKTVKPMYLQINDSKKMSAKKRSVVAEYIKENAVTWGVGCATTEEIDKVNILNVTYLAMHRSIDTAIKKHKIDELYVNGPRFKPYDKDDEWYL